MKKHIHKDSGRRCLVLHEEGHGQCIQCSKCGQWIAPDDFYQTVSKEKGSSDGKENN